MNLTRLAIEKNRISLVVLLIIIIGGVQAYRDLPRDYDPGFVLRVARVVTFFPGASPERVEQLVTDKLEKVIQEIPELDYVKSQSSTGVSIIDVWVQERYRDMRPVWDNLRRKVERAASDLPEGAFRPIVNDEFSDVFGTLIAITGRDFTYRELKTVADEVRDALLMLDEVAKVDLYGVQDERIFVEYSNARLAEMGMSPYQLMGIMKARNIIIPGGSIDVEGERIVLEPSGNLDTLEDLRQTVVQVPGRAEMIFLGDMVDVRRAYADPPAAMMRSNGLPAIGLALSMRQGGNLIQLGDAVTGLLEQVRFHYPLGIDFELVNFAPGEVQEKVSLFQKNLFQAVLMVLGITLVVLGLRTGLVVAALIPMVMLMTLMMMAFLHIGIDQMSLASLVIALGMLVDNAIVMSESIMVRMEEGEGPVPAAIASARELTVPLLTSSLATAASFLPIFLAKSTTGEYTAPLFKVVSIALFSSWVLSMTLIPLLSTMILKVGRGKEGRKTYDKGFYGMYRHMLGFSLRHRGLSLFAVLVVFVMVMFTFRYLPVIFFPPSDRLFFKAELELPPGSTIESTEAMVRDVESFMEAHFRSDGMGFNGIAGWVTHIGQGGPRFLLTHMPKQGVPHYALMIINLENLDDMDRVMADMGTYIRKHYPDAKVELRRIQNGPPVEDPVQIRISGRDSEKLAAIVEGVKERLSEEEGVRDISDDWGRRIKKFVVRVNQPRSRMAGVSSQDIAISLQAGLSGFTLTEFREGDQLIPVSLRSLAADRKDLGKLENLQVYSQAAGRSVPLAQVADIDIVWQPSEVLRRDRLRTVTVSSGLFPGYTANEVMRHMRPWLDAELTSWGMGYRYAFGGETEKSIQANAAIMEQVPVGAFIILMLLMLQFNSFRKTLIIMTTIPLGLIGVVSGLHLTGLYFGFMTLLGIISLSGIVVNNAIVLLDRIRIESEQHGRRLQEAIVEAACRRMRPIFVSAATTALGMVPLLWGGGPIWAPMAVAIIFGLIFSTVLTLGVVPVLYALLFRVRF
ncbi:efflux RND transporter permease subunit [Desulfobotulus sp. H1]|uniref:Efflux RND transporter permease subunit n=1 Tax=Desulfobotulus pelophilus TaxID=2823377 RepID=A0ABT3N8S0_9BACT|nr:efflux RND transporter permease subunit [Desulfobotulus pelophilus]MCW7753840.1 efflux RND transporter permease subunit [Desulfobotulus pelophilus]